MAVTIRLLDVAPDKPPRWLPQARGLLRPFGMQSARLFDTEPVRTVLRHQLAALGQLAGRHAFEVLVPFVGSREELLRWTGLVRESLPQGVPVGAMLESPAAVLDMGNWHDAVDFFAIGSNDLMQCLFATDRDEPQLGTAVSPHAPVLYRVLGQALAAAGGYRERVRLCGVLPRLPGVLPVLLGLGYRRFSVDPVWIPYLARDLAALQLSDAEALAWEVRAAREPARVRALLGMS